MRIDADIRRLEQEDLDALLKAYRDLHSKDAPLPKRAELEQLWRDICEDPRLIYIGAFDETNLVATCNAAIVPKSLESDA